MKEQLALAKYVDNTHHFLDALRKKINSPDTFIEDVLKKIEKVHGGDLFSMDSFSNGLTRKKLREAGFTANEAAAIVNDVLIKHGPKPEDFDREIMAEKIRESISRHPMTDSDAIAVIDWKLDNLRASVPAANEELRRKLDTLETAIFDAEKIASDINVVNVTKMGGVQEKRLQHWKTDNHKPGSVEDAAKDIVTARDVPENVRAFAKDVAALAEKFQLDKTRKAVTGEGIG